MQLKGLIDGVADTTATDTVGLLDMILQTVDSTIRTHSPLTLGVTSIILFILLNVLGLMLALMFGRIFKHGLKNIIEGFKFKPHYLSTSAFMLLMALFLAFVDGVLIGQVVKETLIGSERTKLLMEKEYILQTIDTLENQMLRPHVAEDTLKIKKIQKKIENLKERLHAIEARIANLEKQASRFGAFVGISLVLLLMLGVEFFLGLVGGRDLARAMRTFLVSEKPRDGPWQLDPHFHYWERKNQKTWTPFFTSFFIFVTSSALLVVMYAFRVSFRPLSIIMLILSVVFGSVLVAYLIRFTWKIPFSQRVKIPLLLTIGVFGAIMAGTAFLAAAREQALKMAAIGMAAEGGVLMERLVTAGLLLATSSIAYVGGLALYAANEATYYGTSIFAVLMSSLVMVPTLLMIVLNSIIAIILKSLRALLGGLKGLLDVAVSSKAAVERATFMYYLKGFRTGRGRWREDQNVNRD